MINFIWFIMIISGIILAVVTGKPEVITESSFQAASAGVKYSLELIGVMSFWLGIMKVAEEAGLVQILAKILKPFLKLFFPSIPPDHPAMGSILMNFSANLLGLGNAATPFGLKAMQELQEINLKKDEASSAMCTFLAINTAGITILPATIISIRISAGSANPTEIVGTTLFATMIGMTVALIVDGIMRRIYR
ncbi:MAG: nucleoside recognition domain-containing protein [Clostridia bacterium]|nr:nucleoside recognition domain-containing protein [Clostridia bacterium]MDD4048865.1 nucleoside recognition domain-containing protein [Clostridia bacterium]